MGATRMSSSAGTRSQTSGAVNPPADCATTTRPVLSPAAAATVSAYSGRPAESSSQGRSGATVSWPRSRSSASTRCQYQPTSPAPWMKTNAALRPPSAAWIPGRDRHLPVPPGEYPGAVPVSWVTLGEGADIPGGDAGLGVYASFVGDDLTDGSCRGV